MMPTTKHARMMLANDCDDPFWYSSQTYLPSPSEDDRASAAMSTIQPTPSEILSPANTSGKDAGMTILKRRDQNPRRRTLATVM